MKVFKLKKQNILDHTLHNHADAFELEDTIGIDSNIEVRRYRKEIHAFLLLLLLLFSGIIMGFEKTSSEVTQELQSTIAEEIIRFHVIANSDDEKDQNLKYKVKDALVKELSPYLKEASDIGEARRIILNKIPDIQNIAEEIIEQNGFHYPVTVSLKPSYFPLKIYGEYSFPPGIYEALLVKIGDANGKNWWCVMFPPLCFVDETYSIVDENSEEHLKYVLTEEEFEALKANKAPVRIKFKLWEEWKKLWNK